MIDQKPMAEAVKKRHIQTNGNDYFVTGCLYCHTPKNDTDLNSLEFQELDAVEWR